MWGSWSILGVAEVQVHTVQDTETIRPRGQDRHLRGDDKVGPTRDSGQAWSWALS